MMKVKDLIIKEYPKVELYESVEKVRDLIVKEEFAVIIDEEGQYKGLITIEDVIEKNKKLVVDCMRKRETLESEVVIEKALEIMEENNTSAFEVLVNKRFEGIILKRTISNYLKNKNMELEIVVRERTEELHRINQELKEQTNKLKELKEMAELASKAKSEFLSNMSHEIRTPMNGIIGFTDILYEMETGEEKIEYLNYLKTSSKQLMSLIDDILSLSKIEAGKYEIEEKSFDFFRMLHSISSIYNTLAEEKGISFLFEFDNNIKKYIISDEKAIMQILNNLLGNAIKFTEAGLIKLSANLKLIAGNRNVEIKIEDTGIGINKNKLAKLYEPFEQGDKNLSKKYGGTGLGLSIVKNIVDMMHGDISVKTEEDIGTEFTIILPFNVSEIKSADEIMIADNKNIEKKLKIISAEDVEINQRLLEKMLEDTDWEMKKVYNGKELIEEMKRDKYDIVLMDIQMTEMNGLEATRIIRNNKEYDGIPIIAVSAYALEENISDFIEAGMNDYISKPINKKELIAKLNKWANNNV